MWHSSSPSWSWSSSTNRSKWCMNDDDEFFFLFTMCECKHILCLFIMLPDEYKFRHIYILCMVWGIFGIFGIYAQLRACLKWIGCLMVVSVWFCCCVIFSFLLSDQLIMIYEIFFIKCFSFFVIHLFYFIFLFLSFAILAAAGNSPYGLTPSSQNSSIMSPPPPPSSSQDGWSLNGDYSSAQVKLFLINWFKFLFQKWWYWWMN